MPATALDGGFEDAAHDSARAFRQIMRCMACPGTIATVSGARAPTPLSTAAATLILTLCDHDTPLYLAPSANNPLLRDWIVFHTGAPLTVPEQAHFALGEWDELPIDRFPVGTPEYPDRSTTVIVEIDELGASGAVLTGPGIADKANLSLPEKQAFQRNAILYPLGLDFFFAAGDQLAALPRSTMVT